MAKLFTHEQWAMIEELVTLEMEGHVMKTNWSADSNVGRARRSSLERQRVLLRRYATEDDLDALR